MAPSQLERSRWRVLSVTSVGMFMGTLDATIVSVALPSIGPSLHLSYSEALWTQASYLLLLSVFLIPIGRLADRHGLMRFFMIGAAIFGVFSGICALSFNGPFLIAMRCFQGMGAAFLAATSSALVTAVFPPQERGRGLGINVMAGYVGLMVGPAVGGLLVTHVGWRWIFLINVPIAIITLANGWSLLGAERQDRAEGSVASRAGRGIDWPGSILLALTLTMLFVPLTLLPYWGLASARTLGMIGAFMVLLVAFVLVEKRVDDPVLDLGHRAQEQGLRRRDLRGALELCGGLRSYNIYRCVLGGGRELFGPKGRAAAAGATDHDDRPLTGLRATFGPHRHPGAGGRGYAAGRGRYPAARALAAESPPSAGRLGTCHRGHRHGRVQLPQYLGGDGVSQTGPTESGLGILGDDADRGPGCFGGASWGHRGFPTRPGGGSGSLSRREGQPRGSIRLFHRLSNGNVRRGGTGGRRGTRVVAGGGRSRRRASIKSVNESHNPGQGVLPGARTGDVCEPPLMGYTAQ